MLTHQPRHILGRAMAATFANAITRDAALRRPDLGVVG